MATVYYLAYGSNLHPLRLATRVPSARVIGVVELPDHALAFHKRSRDGSGKALIYEARGGAHCAYGVLYAFDAAQKAALDVFEGAGMGYRERLVELSLAGRSYAAYLYAAESTYLEPGLLPYHWYKRLVLAGARHHGFPADYVAAIEAMPSKADPDVERTRQNEELLGQMERG